LKKNIGSPE